MERDMCRMCHDIVSNDYTQYCLLLRALPGMSLVLMCNDLAIVNGT